MAVTAVAAQLSAGTVMGLAAAKPGAGRSKVTIPVYVQLDETTRSDSGVDFNPQSIAFRVKYSPVEAVKSVRVRRAGVLSALEPLFEAAPSASDASSYIGSFSEDTSRIPFSRGERNVVAELEIVLAEGATLDQVSFKLDPEVTLLSSQDGTLSVSPARGSLRLSHEPAVAGEQRVRE